MSRFKYKILITTAILILLWIVFDTTLTRKDFLGDEIASEDLEDNEIDFDKLVSESIDEVMSSMNVDEPFIDSYEEESKKVEDMTTKILTGETLYEDGVNIYEEELIRETVLDEINTSENLNNDIVGGFIDGFKQRPIDYNISYREATLVDVISGNEIIADVAGVQKVTKLIGLNDSDSDFKGLSNLLANVNNIYLEFDIKRYDKDDKALAYVWLSIPDKENKENMINGRMIKEGYATVDDTPPNIAHIIYFKKIEKERRKQS